MQIKTSIFDLLPDKFGQLPVRIGIVSSKQVDVYSNIETLLEAKWAEFQEINGFKMKQTSKLTISIYAWNLESLSDSRRLSEDNDLYVRSFCNSIDVLVWAFDSDRDDVSLLDQVFELGIQKMVGVCRQNARMSVPDVQIYVEDLKVGLASALVQVNEMQF